MISVTTLSNSDIVQLGREAFKTEFDQMTVINCPFPAGSEVSELWKQGYDEMGVEIQASLQAIAA